MSIAEFLGVNAIILRISAVDGFHKQSASEYERDDSFVAEVGRPVPAEGSLTGDGEIVPILAAAPCAAVLCDT